METNFNKSVRMRILSFDPGIKNVGVAIVKYIGDYKRTSDPKHHSACQSENYIIEWFGNFSLGNKNSTHDENIAAFRDIVSRNKYLRESFKDPTVDVITERQSGASGYGILSGLMRPNFVNGMIVGYSIAQGKNVHIVEKTQKWGWTTLNTITMTNPPTTITIENNKSKTTNQSKSTKPRDEIRKKFIAEYLEYKISHHDTTKSTKKNTLIQYCKRNNYNENNHPGDAVLQAMYEIRKRALEKTYPKTYSKLDCPNLFSKEEILKVSKQITKRYKRTKFFYFPK